MRKMIITLIFVFFVNSFSFGAVSFDVSGNINNINLVKEIRGVADVFSEPGEDDFYKTIKDGDVEIVLFYKVISLSELKNYLYFEVFAREAQEGSLHLLSSEEYSLDENKIIVPIGATIDKEPHEFFRGEIIVRIYR